MQIKVFTSFSGKLRRGRVQGGGQISPALTCENSLSVFIIEN